MKAGKVTMLFFGLTGVGCMVLAIVFSACGLPLVVVTKAAEPVVQTVAEAHEHSKGPIPESQWNNVGLWYRISNTPPTFLPKGYGRDRSRDGRAGTWFIDERDGKKLFVPKGGADGIPEAVLIAEAKQATRWKSRPKLKFDAGSLISGEMGY